MATQSKGLQTPANGADVDDWDIPVNANWNAIDSALGGVTSLNVTSVTSTPVVLTLTQYTPPIVEIAGTLTANVTYQFPSGVGGFWSVFNNSTGAFTITFASLGGGAAIVVPQGFTTAIICDGTNVGYFNTTNIGSTGGMFTPTDASGASLTFTNPVGYWRLQPGQVTVWGSLIYPTTSSGATASLGALPFTSANLAVLGGFTGSLNFSGGGGNPGGATGAPYAVSVANNSLTMSLLYEGIIGLTNAQLSSFGVVFSMTYPI